MKWITVVLFFSVVLLTQNILANTLGSSRTSPYPFSWLQVNNTHLFFQLGVFNVYQGNTQNIGINELLGDRFTVSQHNDQNGLLGLGGFIDGLSKETLKFLYGINIFYLGQTEVKGDIIQEKLYTNLSYRYFISNYPVYLATKVLFNTNSDQYNLTLDLGVGPNIIYINKFQEYSINALPDKVFSSNTSVALSATMGFGVRFNNILTNLPIEMGYRFFYLGRGYLQKNNNQLTSNLNTGSGYANALVMSIST